MTLETPESRAFRAAVQDEIAQALARLRVEVVLTGGRMSLALSIDGREIPNSRVLMPKENRNAL